MRPPQRGQQGEPDPGRLPRVDRPVGRDPLREGAAVDELHDDVGAFVLLDDVVDDDDVRVAEPGHRPGLPQGAFAQLPGRLLRERGVEGQLLDRDTPTEEFVGGTPHDAHTAAADPGLQPVPARYDADALPLGPHAPHHAAPDRNPPVPRDRAGRQATYARLASAAYAPHGAPDPESGRPPAPSSAGPSPE
jgi:hypothetical protein